MAYSYEPLEDRVARGVEWLDEQAPGWEFKIDPATLQLSDCNVCILGQVYEQEMLGCVGHDHDYFGTVPCASGFGHALDHFNLQPYAFDMGFSAADGDYPRLTELWISTVKDRLDKGVSF